MENVSDAEIDRKVNGILQKIYLAAEVLENSAFYREFMEQMWDPEMVQHISDVRASGRYHSNLQMVFYGIGNIDPESETLSSQPEHCWIQLAFAILMREKFDFVSDIVVYDPLILSPLERTALKVLGCNFVEDGKRTVDRPTLFFMPAYCPIGLDDNVLGANWTPENLNKIVVLSYTFQGFPLDQAVGLTKLKAARSMSDHFLHEVPLPRTDITPAVYEGSFADLSWHFFDCFGSSEDVNRLREAMENPKMSAQLKTTFDGKVNRLMQMIYLAREVLENSAFYGEFMEQMRDPELLARIERVRGTDPHHSHFQMVFYGIGTIDPEIGLGFPGHGQMQLAFAILMRERFDFVNDIVVYDPLMSPMERAAIRELGCTFLRFNEDGKRTVDRPTLFFMPFCPVDLIDNVLGANWTPANLKKIIVLSYNFQGFVGTLQKTFGPLTKLKTVLYTGRLLQEVPLPREVITPAVQEVPLPREVITPAVQEVITPVVYDGSFRKFSWHFFAWEWGGSSEDLNRLEEHFLEEYLRD